MKHLICLFAALCVSIPVLAHEGHDHTPGQVQAPHGGVIQKTKDFFVEVKGSSSDAKVYFFTPDMKPMPIADLKVSAMMQLPKKGSKEKVSFKPSSDHFLGTVKAGKTHRYQLEVEIFFKGKRELLTYQIEPQG